MRFVSAYCSRWIVAPLLLYAFSPALAEDLPFASFNQSPLVQIYGLPALGGARVASAGHARLAVFYDVANHWTRKISGNETLTLDGETHRATVSWFRGVGSSMEIGVELPYISHGGGFLDSFIVDWHDAFGMSQGGRDSTPLNQLNFQYTRDGVDRIRLTQATSGVGDIRLSTAWQVTTADERRTDTALRVSLKLPTGDSARLHGSGAADLAAWLSIACGQECPGPFGWYTGGGLLWLGPGDVLTDQQRRVVAFGSAGLHWRALRPLTLSAQFDMHSPFYTDSALRPLEASSVQLVLGGTWFLGRGVGLELAVAEDIRVQTAPDVVIRAGLRSAF